MARLSLSLACVLALAAFAAAPAPAADAPGPLVEAAWLAAHGCDAGIAVLDIRANARSFERARVPCARHAPYPGAGWRAERAGVPAMLPAPEALAATIGGLGVGDSDHVVIVGEGGGAGATSAATRVYWTFKVLGHDAVSLLDGGFAAYRGMRDLATESGAAEPPAAKTFTARLRPELIADAADVAGAAGRLVDNRESDQFAGVNQSGAAARAGTIPGADNVPISWLTRPDGRFQDRALLDDIAAATALKAAGPVITFCNTGQMASLGWFVGHELLGNEQTRLYDGSMAEWSRDPARPVTRRIGGE